MSASRDVGFSPASDFGQWLRRQRKTRDLTQEDLAERLGCSIWAIQKMEAGSRRPSKQLVELLADLFRVPPDERAAFLLFARARTDGADAISGSARLDVEREARSSQDGEAPARASGTYSQAQPGISNQGQSSEDRKGDAAGSPNNLPVQLTSFVGRYSELPRVRDLMLMTQVRLLTLTGAPGTGKTRLALEVASNLLRDFEDGVYFVNLAAVSDPKLLVAEIAQTLGVGESPGQSLLQAVISHISGKCLLLLLDNFEQIVEAAPIVGQLLVSCPRLKVMVTSRAPLQIRGEKEFSVSPLYLPDLRPLPALDGLSRYDAVQLFVERARDVLMDFKLTGDNARAVAEICVRLDGLPLAIELAAARVRTLPPEAILSRLENRLTLLAGRVRDVTTRHLTLRSTIDWSYNLLPEAQRQLFRRLAPFRGGRTLQAIEAVCNYDGCFGTDMLDSTEMLVSSSMLQQKEGPDGEARFWMLETIQEYAREKLEESGEAGLLYRQHALYFMRLAEQAQAHLRDSQQEQWLNRLEDEHDNIRHALAWARSTARESTVDTAAGRAAEDVAGEALDIGLRLGAAAAGFWQVRGYLSEGREQLKTLLAVEEEWERRARGTRSGQVLSTEDLEGSNAVTARDLSGQSEREAYKAAALYWAGMLASAQGDLASARAFYEESLALQRELGDKRGIAASLNILGSIAQREGDLTSARSLYEESVALRRALGDRRGIAASLNNLGVLAFATGDLTSARELYEESMLIRRELGDRQGIAASLNNLGNLAHAQGDFASARALHEESLAMKRQLGDKRGMGASLSNLGNVTRQQRDYVSARALYRESLAIFHDMGDRLGMIVSLAGLGGVDVGVASNQREGVAVTAEATALLRRGARLLAAVEGLLESAGAVLEPEDRAPYERAVAEARSGLGERPFEREWREGRAMRMKQAVEYALMEE